MLLVFRPMNGVFPTTYLWQEITARAWGDRLQVVGVSVSDPYAHRAFMPERDLEDGDYALYADPQNGLAETFGVTRDLDGMAGLTEARPAVFLLDGEHTVRYAWTASEWPEFPDYDAVGAALDDLLAGG